MGGKVMSASYRTFFGLKKDPFTPNIDRKEILETAAIKGVQSRILHAVEIGASTLLTGDIGSGKSTALRYVIGGLHPARYKVIYITATSGSIIELYRQICQEMSIDLASNSKAVMTKRIKAEVLELVHKRMNVVLVIDEASLLRLGVFAELHTLTQCEQDSRPHLSLVMAGQNNLADNLRYRASLPLASRVVGRAHLKGVTRTEMEQYLNHHLALTGIENSVFEDNAVTAIHQGSGGLFRKANHLARGALIAAAKSKTNMVSAEHVRLAATEIF
jgi:type II secretory pathway predicted ATPase ExeA